MKEVLFIKDWLVQKTKAGPITVKYDSFDNSTNNYFSSLERAASKMAKDIDSEIVRKLLKTGGSKLS